VAQAGGSLLDVRGGPGDSGQGGGCPQAGARIL